MNPIRPGEGSTDTGFGFTEPNEVHFVLDDQMKNTISNARQYYAQHIDGLVIAYTRVSYINDLSDMHHVMSFRAQMLHENGLKLINLALMAFCNFLFKLHTINFMDGHVLHMNLLLLAHINTAVLKLFDHVPMNQGKDSITIKLLMLQKNSHFL